MLGLGGGDVRNQHQYTVESMVESSLTYLQRADMESLEVDFPEFKTQVRQLAAKRATRFGIEVQRVTMTVQTSRRRHSVALDPESMAAFDPELAKAFNRGRLTGVDAAAVQGGVVAGTDGEDDEDEVEKIEDNDHHREVAAMEEENNVEIPAVIASKHRGAGSVQIDNSVAEAILGKLSLLENKVNHLQATMAATVVH